MTTRAASILLCLLLVACGGGKKASLADLTAADGPVERQGGDGAWAAAAVGTGFFLGDAARTADGGAKLKLNVGSGAVIAMQPHTILRFGAGKAGGNRIGVELGAIDLTGTGAYQFDVGDVVLAKNGTVRVTAKGKGDATFELTLGEGQLSKANGDVINLTIGQSVDFNLDLNGSALDAGVADAGAPADAAAPPDAAAAADTDIAVEITGKKAELQEGSDPAWKPLPAGAGTFPKGAKLRLGAGTTAKLLAKGTTLELLPGSRISSNDAMVLAIEAGSGKATVPAGAAGEVDVPGGSVTLKGTVDGPGEAKIDVNGRDTKVTTLRGIINLLASVGGASLQLNRGEGASLERNGTIHPTEAIPSFFDFRVAVGDTLTVHDPRPPTAIQFQFLGKCPNGGVIEMDHDSHFRTAKISAGKDTANLMVGGGSWAYRLRCSQGDNEGPPVASGRIAVTRDDGHRPLPKVEATDNIEADGRNYRVSYQSLIPSMNIKFRGSGSAFKLHLAQGGKEQTFDSAKGDIIVPGKSLHEGEYTYWFDHDGVKQDKTSNLKIDFDQSAAQVYIESPNNGQAWAPPIDVRGAALAGWSASVEGTPLPLDRSRRFAAKVDPPPGNALAIRLSHDKLGVHYYLRRQK